MNISSYSDFRTIVYGWADISTGDIPTATMDNLISLAEDRLYREVRLSVLETALAVTFASGLGPLPSDFVELKQAKFSGKKPLTVKPLDFVEEWNVNNTGGGDALYIARNVTNLVTAPATDSGSLIGIYYKRFAAVSGAINAFLTQYPALWLYASLVEVEGFLRRNQRLQVWEGKYKQAKDEAMDADRQREFAGSPMTRGTSFAVMW